MAISSNIRLHHRTMELFLFSIILSSGLGLTSLHHIILTANAQNVTATETPQSNSKLDFRLSLRDLMTEQAAYTRNEILSVLGDLPDSDAVMQRLLKVQQDIANATVPYYGQETAKKLGDLLNQYATIPIEGLKELRIGNAIGSQQRLEDWRIVADQISTLLAETNPAHPQSEWKALFDNHIELARTQALDRRLDNYTGDIEAFDGFLPQSLKIADTLADSIITKFPDKFQ